MATLVSLLLLSFLPLSTSASINILSYGAKPNGKTDATKAFLAAWAAACRSSKSSTINVPDGRFLLGPIVFQGPCKSKSIKFSIAGTLVAPASYTSFGSTSSWINFNRVNGLSIHGGKLNGNGNSLWKCKKTGKKCPVGPTSLVIGRSQNVEITGLTSINSKFFHILIHNSGNVAVKNCKFYAPDDSPNTDGVHVQRSRGITVTGSTFMTGDDCVSIGPGTSNVWVEDVHCGPGHGISIGSLAQDSNEPGVQNVTVRKIVFSGTQNGLRIKTWGRPSNGFVKDVVFEHVVMKNVQNAIAIDQNYCPMYHGCPNQNSGIKISDVKYNDIRGTSASEVAVKLDCSPSNPCKGIGLKDVKLTYKNQPAKSTCKYVVGKSKGKKTTQNCI